MVMKKSRILRIKCIEGRRGYLQFNAFSKRFVYPWHLTMQGMENMAKVVKLQGKVSEVIFNIVVRMVMCIRLTNVRLSIHSTHCHDGGQLEACLCHIGHDVLKFSLILLNSEKNMR